MKTMQTIKKINGIKSEYICKVLDMDLTEMKEECAKNYITHYDFIFDFIEEFICEINKASGFIILEDVEDFDKYLHNIVTSEVFRGCFMEFKQIQKNLINLIVKY